MKTLIAFDREDLESLIREVIAEVLPHVQKTIPPTGNDLLSRKDAAKYLGVSMPTLRSWEDRGFITAKRLGSRVYFSKAALESFNINTSKHK